MSYDDEEGGNIAATLAQVLPKAGLLGTVPLPAGVDALTISHYSVPKGTDVKELKHDLEHLLPASRATRAHAKLAGPTDFLAYVARHKKPETLVWCDFNPQSFRLKFTAVIDEHAQDKAGWRRHTAELDPLFSAEWKVWKETHDRKPLAQTPFAEFLQENGTDIASTDESAAAGYPSALQMLTMATNFVHNEERSLKSSVRLQSGGVRLTYVADADTGTTAEMAMFEKFQIGIPVFHGAGAWAIDARLKYRNNSGKLSFHYELVRPDRVHQAAAEQLIDQVRTGLGEVPLLFGVCGQTRE
jgi:uncharacterized protein YfdQ (DUF2303 family)